MSDEKKEISKAPPPIIPLSGSSSPPLIWHKPDWNFWKHKTKIKLWEAAFLCCDIDPRNQDYRDIKGRHYEKVAIYLNLLKDNFNRLDFNFVNPPEVAEWALSKDLDIPKELAALAKKPDTPTVVHMDSKQADEEICTTDTNATGKSENTIPAPEEDEETIPLYAKTKARRKEQNKPSIFGSELGGLSNDLIYKYEREHGEPELAIGTNKRPLIDAWINFKAPKLRKAGDTIPTLAKKLELILNKWGFESERSKLSIGTIKRILTDRAPSGRKY